MYGRSLLILAAIQGLALIVENSYDNSIIFIWLATYSCGLQNSMTSKYSGNAVRTTHLTGASTDFGIALGHILKGRRDEWWKVHMHGASRGRFAFDPSNIAFLLTATFPTPTNHLAGIAVVGFFIGGILGFFAFEQFEHAALLVNVCLTSACGIIHILYVAYHERMTVISVLESRSECVPSPHLVCIHGWSIPPHTPLTHPQIQTQPQNHSIRIHKHRRQITDPPPASTRALPRSPRLRTSSLTASIQTKTSVRPHQTKPRRGSHPQPLRGPMPPAAAALLLSPTGAGAVTASAAVASPELFAAPPSTLETGPTVTSLDGTASSLLTDSSLRRTGGGGGPTPTTGAGEGSGSVATDGAVIAAEEGQGSGGEEEGEVWGHSPSSSVCGLEEDDDIELTPEELGPLPTYDKGDIIAAMAAEEEEDEEGEEDEQSQEGGGEADGADEGEGDEEEGRARRPPVLLLGRWGDGAGGSPPLERSPPAGGGRQLL